jgi:diguanylate cyclase (GGDEF)-like protein
MSGEPGLVGAGGGPRPGEGAHRVEDPAGPAQGRRVPIYLLVVVIWLTVLAGVFAFVVTLDLRAAAAGFHERTDRLYQHLGDRVLINESVIEGFAAMVEAVGEIDRGKLGCYAREVLGRYPHIHMLEVADRVSAGDLQAFEAEQRQHYPEFAVRAFAYEGDRGWHPVPDKPFYLPLVFMEPMPAESRQVLGLDLDSNGFFRRSLRESARLGRPVATEPFRLVEGAIAYVVHRPVGIDTVSAAPALHARYVLLVVRADTLLPPGGAGADGMAVAVGHRDLQPDDPEGELLRVGSTRGTPVEAALFPRLQCHREVASETQPFVLRAEQQLGWADLNWPLIVTVLATGALTFWAVLAYARAYHAQEILRLEEADRLFNLANFDALTGLANRNLLLDRLQHALARARREGYPLVLLFMDLDGFKRVNDNCGHAAGDEVLKLAGDRLRGSLREADTLARRSGDEFLAVLEHLAPGPALATVIDKIRAGFERPFEVGGCAAQLGISIGIASFPNDATTIKGLLEQADAAMYLDKRRHGSAQAPPADARASQPPDS